MYPYRMLIREHLQQVDVRWLWRGGAGIEWAEQQIEQAVRARIIILFIGGNDLANGWCSPLQLADRMGRLAQDFLNAGAELVVIPSLWPRSNAVYNSAARGYATLMEASFYGHPEISFWLWDRRQSWLNYDGIHFAPHGYELAIRYLVAIVIWVINHNLW